jgi:hypothetical protein
VKYFLKIKSMLAHQMWGKSQKKKNYKEQNPKPPEKHKA